MRDVSDCMDPIDLHFHSIDVYVIMFAWIRMFWINSVFEGLLYTQDRGSASWILIPNFQVVRLQWDQLHLPSLHANMYVTNYTNTSLSLSLSYASSHFTSSSTTLSLLHMSNNHVMNHVNKYYTNLILSCVHISFVLIISRLLLTIVHVYVNDFADYWSIINVNWLSAELNIGGTALKHGN